MHVVRSAGPVFDRGLRKCQTATSPSERRFVEADAVMSPHHASLQSP